MVDFDYLAKIRNTFSILTNKRASNILEGDFMSVYRGRSLEFDELSEYTYGDNVQDIDWKSSSRAGRTLVRRYVANKKHFVLFIVDSGDKMTAHTSAGEWKKDIACTALGTIGYLVDGSGADYALLRHTKEGFEHSLFRSGMPHLDQLLYTCAQNIGTNSTADITALLDFAVENIRKKMILCLITDLDGLMRLDEHLVQKVTYNNDLVVVNIDDAFLTDDYAFDLQNSRYADTYLVRSKKLRTEERRQRGAMLRERANMLYRQHAGFCTIARESEIVDRVIALFDHRTWGEVRFDIPVEEAPRKAKRR